MSQTNKGYLSRNLKFFKRSTEGLLLQAQRPRHPRGCRPKDSKKPPPAFRQNDVRAQRADPPVRTGGAIKVVWSEGPDDFEVLRLKNSVPPVSHQCPSTG